MPTDDTTDVALPVTTSLTLRPVDEISISGQAAHACKQVGRPRYSDMERGLAFFAKVRSDDAGCWNWIGTTSRGYGQFWIGRPERHVYAHRWAYELLRASIPVGLTLDHLCRNRHCVNPYHLELVTPQENTLRGETLAARNAVKATCPVGHTYDVRRGKARGCRRCEAAAQRRYYARKKASR